MHGRASLFICACTKCLEQNGQHTHGFTCCLCCCTVSRHSHDGVGGVIIGLVRCRRGHPMESTSVGATCAHGLDGKCVDHACDICKVLMRRGNALAVPPS